MCNQAVSLVAAELERRGIATVAIQLLRNVAANGFDLRARFSSRSGTAIPSTPRWIPRGNTR